MNQQTFEAAVETVMPPPEADGVYVFPVSFAQQRLWFLSRLQPESAAYNFFGAFVLTGRLHRGALDWSFREIVERHEILRTTFAMMEGQPVQLVNPHATFELPLVDMRGLDSDKRDTVLGDVLRRESLRPFDLLRGPLLRAILIELEEQRHVLFYAMHHIVTDGWSESILVREVSILYQAFAAGEQPELPDLSIQYGDFVQWQRGFLTDEVVEELITYWKRQLAGVPTVLELATDYPRSAVFRHRGASLRFSLSGELTAAVRSLSQRDGSTLFMTLLAAFGVLLHRHSGQDRIVVGSPVANRGQIELENLIGFFVNTLPLCLDLRGNPPFREFLVRVREMTYGAQEHQNLPFEKLVTDLELERDVSRNPLFQVAFLLETKSHDKLDLGELGLERYDFAVTTAKFDLTLGLTETHERLEGSLEYASDLFERATIERLLNRFLMLLEGICVDAERRVCVLPVITPAERESLLHGERASCTPDFSGGCLHQRFQEQVRRRPEAIAVVCGEESLSYAELDLWSGELAYRLTDLHDHPARPRRVCLCLERSLEMVVAILATLKAGAAYVPLDPAYPQERLRYLLKDAGTSMVFTDERGEQMLPAFDGVILRFDRPAPGGDDRARWKRPERSLRTVAPESPAYVIYTSGSTGTPKGVIVSHSNVTRLFDSTQAWFRFQADDVWSFFHSYAFDFSVWEVWGAFLFGGRLVVVPYWVSRSPQAFSRLMYEERVSMLSQTPTAFYQLMRTEEATGVNSVPQSLRYVIFGGEALDLHKLTPWFVRHSDRRPRVINMYGITETTVHSTYRRVTQDDLDPAQGSPIGCPLPDLRIHLLDAFGQLVPPGVPGEMFIAGAGVAAGYLNRPALTAQRFVPDPFSAVSGERLYRSGDLSRLRADGELEFLRRIDHQVKIRGFRIEPAEVESAVAKHPSVAEAAVTAWGAPGEPRLVAYVVVLPGAPTFSFASLRSFLETKLPEHLMPAALVTLDTLPRTVNGKLDRRALPEPNNVSSDSEQKYVPPRNPIEGTLAAILSAVLGVDRLGVEDNFFHFGGDSIRSVEALALIREKGFAIELKQLFQFPTVADLAREIRFLDRKEEEALYSEPFSLVSPEDRARLPQGLEDAYPLSSLQAGMFYHQEQTPDDPVFHNVNSWHLRLPLDPEVFRSAVLRITARHPVLRTSFDLASYSEPLQLVHRKAVFPVEVEDLCHLSKEAQVQRVAEITDRELRRPFDLSRPPQLRFHTLVRSSGSFQLILTENHVILDGWSLHTFFDEVLRTYFSMRDSGLPPALPSLKTTYRDFVNLERQALGSKEFEEYWDRKLEGYARSRVARWFGHSRDPLKRRIKSTTIVLPEQVIDGLSKLARTEAVPMKTVFLAAHLKVMSFVCGQRDVLTCISYHGRPETPDGHRACGLFLNMLTLRMSLGGASWRDLVRQTHAEELDVLPYRRYPLAVIQKKWGREPLLESEFVYLDFHILGHFAETGEVQVVGQGEFVEETNFPIVATFTHTFGNREVVLCLDCDRDVLSEPQIDAMLAYYNRTLEEMARAPESRYDTINPFSAAENQCFLEWNDSDGSCFPRAPVHELFEDQATRTPDLPALIWGSEIMTYGELSRRANQLGRHLRKLGVGPEVRVGLCTGHSLEMMIGILGVMTAGGAYVPMDPSYPRERLRFLLDDAQVTLLLSEQRSAERLPVHQVPIFFLDTGWNKIAGESGATLAPVADPQNLAYIIYTSGSTGRPKGVCVEHQQLFNYLGSIREKLDLSVENSFALVSTAAADLGHTMIFGALASGGCLHLFSEQQVRDPGALADAFLNDPIDFLKVVPFHLAALLEHPHPEIFLPRLGLILGGEALNYEWVDKWRHLAPDLLVYNEYGPTETTVAVTIHRLECGRISATPPIGRPMVNSRVHVLDSVMQPVPLGVAGELFIGGAQISRGYYRRYMQTAERFIPDPFGETRGARLYRSGDLARFLPGGMLEFLGRIDQQVKIRGFRVEPGEIESVLREHPEVHEAVVIWSEESRRLVGYLVTEPGREPIVEKVRTFLAEKLPEYMVPESLVELPALPLTLNGKLDRQALPSPDESQLSPQQGRKEPRNLLEVQLMHIWEDLLEVEGVGATEDFFELGGDSFLAVRLIAQIRRQLMQDLPLASLTQERTIEKLSKILRHEEQYKEHLVVPMQPRGSGSPLYCVSPGHGSIICYLGLARYLGTERPFYGLQWPDLQRSEDPYLGIEEIAACYLEELRAVQPEGPYLVSGWSFGGLVAYEMAQQLQRAGEEVPALYLLDARTPACEKKLFEMEPEVMQAYLVVEHAKLMAGTTRAEMPISPKELLGLTLPEQLEFVMKEFKLHDNLPQDFNKEEIFRYFEIRLARMRALGNYAPQPYEGPVTLFRCQEIYEDAALEEVRQVLEEAARSPSYGWNHYCRDPIKIIEIPGNHEAMVFEPIVAQLASHLATCLRELAI